MPTLEEVQNAIRDQGLNWIAADNPIADNYARGKMPGLGLATVRSQKGRDWLAKKIKPKHTLQLFTQEDLPVVDWGAFSDIHFLSPVRDQKNCGACVAFATCAVLEARIRIVKDKPKSKCNLSQAQLFFCGAGAEACDNGWEIGKALTFIRDNGGIGAASDFPYRLNDTACSEARRMIKPVVDLVAWRRIKDNETRFEVLRQRGPVVGAMAVHSDFLYYCSGVYRPTNADIIGLHAIAVVGYDKQQGAWIIQNSWGDKWGRSGFAYIGFGSCGIDHEYGFYDMNIKLL